MKKNKNKIEKGLHLSKLNILISSLAFIFSAMLIIATIQIAKSYREMKNTTDKYIEWEQCANDMQLASDYLTEQARCFVETGNRIYLNNYFEEFKVTKRRENALSGIRSSFSGTNAYSSLETALNESYMLMEREFYAMRLTVESLGHILTEYPNEIQDVILSEEDKLMTPDKQSERARTLMFDYMYKEKKDIISDNMNKCLAELEETTKNIQQKSSGTFQRILLHEQGLIVIIITIVIVIVIITTQLIIKPLMNAVTHINNEDLIPITGSYEFRFLADTYNRIYETNLAKREHLFYEATHDALSDTYNRSGYEIISREINSDNYAIMIIDIDKFKKINDTYGHPAGDKVITKIASILKENFQNEGYICRIGGDEFIIILPHSDYQTEPIKRKIDEINEILSHREGDRPSTSISVGVAFVESGQSFDDIFKDADKALYTVKGNGRHGVAFYSPSDNDSNG